MGRVSSDADELTLAEETLIANLQAGTGQAEVPTGVINGSNTAFTLSKSPSPVGSLKLVLNGITLKAGGEDYTLAGTGITMVSGPLTGSIFLAWYLIDTDT